MANKFINIVTLSLFSIIIGRITAAPVDSSKQHVGKGFSDVFLKILDNNAPTPNGYQGVKVLGVERISNDTNPLYKAILRLEPKCPKNLSCLPEICSFNMFKDPSTSKLMATTSMRCYHDFSTNILNLVDGRIKREVGDEHSDDDQIMDEFMNQIYIDEDLFSSHDNI